MLSLFYFCNVFYYLENESLITAGICSPRGTSHLFQGVTRDRSVPLVGEKNERRHARARKKELKKSEPVGTGTLSPMWPSTSHVMCNMCAWRKGAPCCLATPHCASKTRRNPGRNLPAVSVRLHFSPTSRFSRNYHFSDSPVIRKIFFSEKVSTALRYGFSRF